MGQARSVLQECRDTNHKLYGKPLKDFDICPLCTALDTALRSADSWKKTAEMYERAYKEATSEASS
jgi:hypothetical protein